MIEKPKIMIRSELKLYQNHIKTKIEEPTNATASELFDRIDAVCFPAVAAGMQILLTYVVSTATAERSFSTLKRLKTWLRSKMTQDRLTGLALLHIHSDIPLSAVEILDRFCRASARRLNNFSLTCLVWQSNLVQYTYVKPCKE